MCENLIFNLDNIFESIKFLVSNNKSHNDIKPDNMIYSKVDNKVKFIDLGSISSLKTIATSGVATTPMFASLPIMYIVGKTSTMNARMFE